MLKLIRSLVETQLVSFLESVAEETGPHGRVCVVFSSPMLHSALMEAPIAVKNVAVEVTNSVNTNQILESTSQILILEATTGAPVCRTVVMAPRDEQLVGGPASAVVKILEHFRAMPFIDAFDGPVLTQLRATLRHRGVAAFVNEAFAFIECFRRGDSPDPSGWSIDRAPVRQGPEGEASYTDHWQHMQSLIAFLEWVRRVQDPHCYLKALLSCFSYLQSNKNASQASRELNISRTTLHDHLRIAGQYRIDSLLEASRGVSFHGPRIRAKP